MNNLNNLISMYQALKQDPMGVLSKSFNLPQNIDISNPNSIIQHLLDTNQISQAQVNYAMNLRNNPLIMKMFNMK